MENQEYALLTVTEFRKLQSIANSKGEPTVISSKNLVFIYSIITLIDYEECELEIQANYITIKAKMKAGNEIYKSFPIALCEEYYLHPNRFINEILNI